MTPPTPTAAPPVRVASVAGRLPDVAVCREAIVPLFNERVMIPAVYAAMLAFVDRHPGWRVRFVDDGSTDDTAGFLQTLLTVNDADGRLVLEALPANVGKADAVAHGFRTATAPRVFFTDGDLAYDPELLVKLDRALETSDLAIGSRAIAEGSRSSGRLRVVLGESYNLLVRGILGLPHRDTQAGIKGFRREAADDLFARRSARGFGFDAELLFLARRRGYRVAEIPAKVNDSHAAAGSNVRLVRDTLGMLASLARIRIRALRGAYRD